MALKCLIIDDEPLARECVGNYVIQTEFLELAGTGSNPIELTQLLDKQTVDLIFLDIQMPFMNGIDFLKMTTKSPMVIITTAYPSYALEGFQLDVLDYLVKPITFARFFKAATKARDYHHMLRAASPQHTLKPTEDYFFIKCDYKYERINLNEIQYIQALQNYITIYTTKGKFITLLSLKRVEQHLDPKLFIRIHKSFIVSITKIDSIENNEVLIQSSRIPVSRNFREEVIDRVVADKLWKKQEN